MTRSTLSAANQTEVAKAALRVEFFMELAFPGGTIRITTADRDITWGGNTYTAKALLLDAGAVSESSDLKARRIAFKLSGVDGPLLTRIRTDAWHYARVQFYIGFFTEAWALVADPYALGDELLMSHSQLRLGEGTAEVELSAETWDIFGERDSAVLATPETQRQRYPGDSGMDRVAILMTQEIQWGGVFARVPSGSGTRDGVERSIK